MSRTEVGFDRIVSEFMGAVRRGEQPDVVAFQERFPAHAARIGELFPAMAKMAAAPASEDTASLIATPEATGKRRRSTGARTPGGRPARRHASVSHDSSAARSGIRVGPASVGDAFHRSLPGGVPRRIGPYQIEALLGQGGMGQVFAAVQDKLQRRVALKVLPDDQEVARRRFEREMRIVAALEHQHIVPIYDAGYDANSHRHYYAMRLVEGVSVDRLIAHWRGFGPPPGNDLLVDSVLEILATATGEDLGKRSWSGREQERYRAAIMIIRDAGSGLAHAHGEGVLHRDIKPGNILIDRQGRAYLADFGIAKDEGASTLTQAGFMPGTAQYMAPEQFGGEVDRRSDIYALGVTLYELVTLSNAFARAQSTQDLYRAICKGLPEPRHHTIDLPPSLNAVIVRATARNVRTRYPRLDAMLDDLTGSADGRRIAAPPPRRTLLIAGTVGALALLLLVVSFWPQGAAGPSAAEARPEGSGSGAVGGGTATNGADRVRPSSASAPTTETGGTDGALGEILSRLPPPPTGTGASGGTSTGTSEPRTDFRRRPPPVAYDRHGNRLPPPRFDSQGRPMPPLDENGKEIKAYDADGKLLPPPPRRPPPR